ncbi:hypothetical protein [Rhizobium laguerreae]|uniref:hypothetical protein n=1 Tax=Rhizobium laguerreae TaxID=1076926 RepID=UPI001C92B327|nr:hypothetical protein [Rhizobium laguerreae]MBY3488976.1 hypothetical protein [Rhizobium laguerreae]
MTSMISAINSTMGHSPARSRKASSKSSSNEVAAVFRSRNAARRSMICRSAGEIAAIRSAALDACRKAANRQLPASVVAANFSRFLKKHGKLADMEDVPLHLRRVSDRNVSGI